VIRPAVLAVAMAALASSPPLQAVETGEAIFEGADGAPGLALIGSGSIEAPAQSFACANCHGVDGMGLDEGTMISADISAWALSRPRSAETGDRPAYTRATLARAIVAGVDPTGRALDAGMPRYRFGHADLESLLDYLEALSVERTPGLTGEEVRLVFLKPTAGDQAGLGRELEVFITNMLYEMNLRRALSGRKIVAEIAPIDPSDQEAVAARIAEMDEAGTVFAFFGALGVEPGGPAAREIAARDIPVIAPFFRREERLLETTFAFRPNAAALATALLPELRRAASGEARVAIVAGAGEQRAADTAAAALAEAGVPAFVAEDAATIAPSEPALIVGGPEALSTVVAATDGPSAPLFGFYDDLVDAAPSESRRLGREIILAGPGGRFDLRSEDVALFRLVSGMLGGRSPRIQAMAFSALSLVETVLGSLGREIDRPRFVQAIRDHGPFEIPFAEGIDFSAPDGPALREIALFRTTPKTQRVAPLTTAPGPFGALQVQ
jgi:mono/diheme cytochrome c family protein